jgi:2-alkenal reductase
MNGRRRRVHRCSALIVAAVCAASLSGCAVLKGSLDQILDSPGVRSPARTSLPGARIDPPKLFHRASPAIVTVISQYGGPNGPLGLGSGFVAGDSSTIITNTHVVTSPLTPGERATHVNLQLADGTRMSAAIVGFDPHADIAVLHAARPVAKRTLRFARQIATIGDPVMAIGSPLGETYTMSLGYVTGVDRRISGLAGFKIYGAIQTDAVITMGNSGGPLLNASGEVIGVTGQMLSVGGGGEGLGFAIPAALARRSAAYLSKGQHVPYAYLGVNGKPLWRGAGGIDGLPSRPGVLVGQVRMNSPAARVGLRGGTGDHRVQGSNLRLGGDLITAIGDHRLAYNEQLGEALLAFKPGETVTITYYRDGARRAARVTLTDRPVLWPNRLHAFFG